MRVPDNIIRAQKELLQPFYPALTIEGVKLWLRFIPRGAAQKQLATVTDAAKGFGMPASTLRLRIKQASLEPVETRPSRGGFTCYYRLDDLKRVSGMFCEDTTPEQGNGQAPPASP